ESRAGSILMELTEQRVLPAAVAHDQDLLHHGRESYVCLKPCANESRMRRAASPSWSMSVWASSRYARRAAARSSVHGGGSSVRRRYSPRSILSYSPVSTQSRSSAARSTWNGWVAATRFRTLKTESSRSPP